MYNKWGLTRKTHIVFLWSVLKTYFPPCQDHASIDGACSPQHFLWLIRLRCPLNGWHWHWDITWTLFLSVPPPRHPRPLGWFPASAPLTPPFWIERLTMHPEASGLFLHLQALLSSLLPLSVKCTKWQGAINCKYFGNFGISACGPQGCPTKDWRPYCCCVPLWWQPIAWQRCDNSSFQI